MKQRPAFIGAIVLTAFFLTVFGALITQVARESTAARVPDAPPVATVAAAEFEPAPTLDTAPIKSVIAEREAAYQQLLDKANKQLVEANTQLQRQADELKTAQTSARVAQAQLQQTQTRPVAPPASAKPAPPPQYAVSADQAQAIAVKAAQGATTVKAPELVQFEGKVAYEVAFKSGVVYVDANTGKVLYSSVEVQANNDGPNDRVQAGKAGSSHESEGHDDHEEQEHEQAGD